MKFNDLLLFSFEICLISRWWAGHPCFNRSGTNMFNSMFFCNFDTVEEEFCGCVFVCRVHRVKPSNHEDELRLYSNLENSIDKFL